VTIDNCYDQVSDPVSNQYVGTALARSEQLVTEQWLQGEEGGHIPMPGQRRLTISRLRVPNLDGSINAAAGNLLSIGSPRHRKDPVFVRSQYTNQQKQRGEKLQKTYIPELPLSVDWQIPDCKSQILMVVSLLPLAICFPSGLHATERTLKL